MNEEVRTCQRCGAKHTDNYDVDVPIAEGNDVQAGGCLDCWIETWCGRYPLVLDAAAIEKVVHHDPTA